MKPVFFLLVLTLLVFQSLSSQPSGFKLMAPGTVPAIVTHTAEDDIIQITANQLADDMERITGIRATRTIDFQLPAPGIHTLKIFAPDPGVIPDNIVTNFGDPVTHYRIIRETIIE